MFLDIAVGIFLAIGLDRFSGIVLSAFSVAVCVGFALLPDVDFLFHLATGGTSRNAQHHRDLLHYPLIYIPIGFLVIQMFSAPWTLAFVAASFCHFLHDSIGIGWGVQWLYPFNNNHYSFLYIYKPKNKKPLPKQWIYAWPHADIDTLNEKHGDPDWIKNIYLNWHPYAIVEFVVFLVAIIILFLV